LLKDNRVRATFLIGALLIGVLAAYNLAGVNESSEPMPQLEGQETYASPDENSVIEGNNEDSNEVETVVTIDSSVSPSRPTVDIGETVRFQNENDFAVRIEFEGSDDKLIEAGEMIEIGFRSIEYYEVYNDENDEKIAGGGISLDI